MANSIIGQILSIGQPQSFTSKNGQPFTKRSLVVSVRRFDPNTGEPVNDYENTPEFSFFNDRCRDLDQFQVGQNVCVYFDLTGRKYIDNAGVEKIINDIRPYKIEPYSRTAAQPLVGASAPAPQPMQPTYPQQAYAQPAAAQPTSAPLPGFVAPI